MNRAEVIAELALEVKELFEHKLGRYDAADLVEVAASLVVAAREEREKLPRLKPLGDAHIPDLIGTNFSHALNEFEWRSVRPVSDDGVIVHRFEAIERAGTSAEYLSFLHRCSAVSSATNGRSRAVLLQHEHGREQENSDSTPEGERLSPVRH